MDGPIVYVTTWRVKDGRFEDYRRFHAELVRVVEENEPQVSAFLGFANEDRSEITTVHVYPDGATLERHMSVLDEKAGLLPADLTQIVAFVEPIKIDVYGTPSGKAAEMDRGLAETGVAFTTKEHYLGGFTRPGSAVRSPSHVSQVE